MPSVIDLRDLLSDRPNRQKDLFFLVKEEDFPIEAVQLIQNQVKDYVQSHESYTREKLIEIVEDIIDEYSATLVDFKLYIVSY